MLILIDIDENVFDKIHNCQPVDYTTLYNSFKNSKPLSEVLYTNSWEENVNMLKGIYNDK